MKIIRMVTIVAGIGALLCFAGCGEKTPDEVTLDALKTIQSGKATPEYLAKNCTANAAALFAMSGEMLKEASKGATFTYVDTEIDGDKAVVTILQQGGENPGLANYDLVRVDGRWKLDVNKEEHDEDE